jgi:hypothetical protein
MNERREKLSLSPWMAVQSKTARKRQKWIHPRVRDERSSIRIVNVLAACISLCHHTRDIKVRRNAQLIEWLGEYSSPLMMVDGMSFESVI